MSLAASGVTFGDAPLGRFRRTHVEQWVKSMSVADLAPGTSKTRFVNVRSVLRAAARDRVIARDSSDGVTLPRLRKREASMVLPIAEQVAALLEAADWPFEAYVALCAFAGLRLGEAAALKVDDIDFLRRQITISRQVQRAGGGAVEIRPPKYGSELTIYPTDELLTLFGAREVTCDRAVVVHGRDGAAAAPEHRGAPLAADLQSGRRQRRASARPPALLRVGTHSSRVRRRNRSTRPRPRPAGHDPEHVFAPLAEHRRPHSEGGVGDDARNLRVSCPCPGHRSKPLSRANALNQTLKRNSTTSPSRIT